jgi:hypothetical protein
LDAWSPKMKEILIRISRHTQPGVLDEFKKIDEEPKKSGKAIGPILVYSQFLDSGIAVLGKAMERYGVREIKKTDDILSEIKNKNKNKGAYCIISGEVETEIRAELLKIFTSPENIRGEILPILLFTSTGAEGMDTKYVRAVLAIECYWHWARMEQIFARGVRLGSHMDLPESDRTVQPYLFLSDYPLASSVADIDEDHFKNLEHRKKQEDTTDVTLYSKALQNRYLINQFLRVMQESSIDCTLWNNQNDEVDKIRCRVCQPTDRMLFMQNLDKDMLTPSACQEERKEEKVKAKSVIVKTTDGKKDYKYSVEGDDIHIYEFNEKLNGYEEVEVEHPNYLEIYKAIGKKEKIPAK